MNMVIYPVAVHSLSFRIWKWYSSLWQLERRALTARNGCLGTNYRSTNPQFPISYPRDSSMISGRKPQACVKKYARISPWKWMVDRNSSCRFQANTGLSCCKRVSVVRWDRRVSFHKLQILDFVLTKTPVTSGINYTHSVG